MKKTLAFLLTLTFSLAFAGDFEVRNDGNGIKILYRGEILIDTIVPRFNGKPLAAEIRSEETLLPDGRRAWNRWSEEPDIRHRFEVVLSPAGDEVEITFLTECTAWSKYPGRAFTVGVPWDRVKGMSWKGKTGRTSKVSDVEGTLSDSIPNKSLILKGTSLRQLAVDGGQDFRLVFDFNPLGVGDFLSDYSINSLRGLWGVYRRDGKMIMEFGTNMGVTGGHIGGKMRIYQGMAGDYRKYHAQERLSYDNPFPPLRLYSFGSGKHGANYKTVDLRKAGGDSDGWSDDGNAKTVGGNFPGVYYSALSGRNGAFRLVNLEPGVYILSLGAGNFSRTPNKFRILVDGQPISEYISVPSGEAMLVKRAIWIEKGTATVSFEGDYLLSMLGLQELLHAKEDYSFRRGIWAVDGFEPSVLYRNEHYRPEAAFSTAISTFALPEPGKETAAPLKKMDYPMALPTAPMEWRYNAKISSLGSGNDSSINEYTEPEALARRLDELKAKNVNLLFVNGMLSRHTYPRHIRRATNELKKISEAAHARGMRVLDHQDLTLLWNIDSGYRVMCEQLDLIDARLDDMLPTPHYCPVNPAYREKAYDYFTKFIFETGIDAIMIDEVAFWSHSCLCAHCRRKFHEDTGWYLPVNELDPRLKDTTTPLYKAFREWRKREIGNWWVGLRRRVSEKKPEFSFMAYSTHYGFTSNWTSLSIGLDLTQLARGVDFLGTEIMTRNVLESSRSVLTLRRMKNTLRHAFNTPIFGLVYPERDWDLAYFGWALNNMNGQVTWEHVGECPKGKSDYHLFAAENMNMVTAKPVAEAALLFSVQSRDWNRSFGFRQELMGIAQTLEEIHIPYEMISEYSLNEKGLASYKLLFVGASGCLSDAHIDTIRAFAKNGGTVILSPVAGLYDELGNVRAKWAFEDIFGFGFNFLKLNTAPCAVIIDSDGKEMGLVKKPVYFRPDGLRPHKESMFFAKYAGKPYPLTTTRPYGKGRFIMHHASLGGALEESECTPGKKYTFLLDEQLAKVTRQLLSHEFAGADAGFRTDAPERVYTSVFTDGGRTVVHLLNATGKTTKNGEVMRRGAPKVPFPPINRDIVITVRRESSGKAYAVSPDYSGRRELPVTQKDGRCTVKLPGELLKAYTLVFIE